MNHPVGCDGFILHTQKLQKQPDQNQTHNAQDKQRKIKPVSYYSDVVARKQYRTQTIANLLFGKKPGYKPSEKSFLQKWIDNDDVKIYDYAVFFGEPFPGSQSISDRIPVYQVFENKKYDNSAYDKQGQRACQFNDLYGLVKSYDIKYSFSGNQCI